MAEMRHWDDFDDEDPYPLYEVDHLGVLSSTREVVEQGEYVWIDRERVELLSDQWAQNVGEDDANSTHRWYDRYHFH